MIWKLFLNKKKKIITDESHTAMQSLFKHTTTLFRNCSQQTTRLTATVEVRQILLSTRVEIIINIQ